MKPSNKDLQKYNLKTYIKNETVGFSPLAEKTSQDPKRKRVHDLRVSIRKMRSLMDEEGLKKLGKALGKVRDLDVAIRNAKAYHLDNKELKKERKILRNKLKTKLKPSKLHEINIKLKTASNEVRKNPNISSRAKEMIKKLRRWNHHLKTNELHPFRKTIKEVRYFLEATGHKTEYLVNLQDHLGKVHDLEVFSRYFEKQERIKKEREDQIKVSQKLAAPTIKRALAELHRLE